VHLSDLIRFIQQPVVHYFKEQLGLSYSDTQELIADREPIAMDGLTKWQLADNLLNLALTQGTINTTDALLRARAGGTLPLGTPGKIILDERTEVIEKGSELFAQATQGKEPLEPLNIDLTLPGKLRLIGQVPGRWNNTSIFVDTGKENAKRLMTPWMHYLAWTAQQPEDEATTRLLLCAREKDGSVYAQHVKFEMAGSTEERQELARTQLSQLIQWYLLGKQHPIRFMQKTSHAFAEAAHGVLSASQFAHGPASGLTDDQYEALSQARRSASKAWDSNQNFSGEGADYHLAKTFEAEPPHVLTREDGSETAHPDFAWYALKFWSPLLNARHEETTS
jgi:exodeoxyribonuclease V gamma subunit